MYGPDAPLPSALRAVARWVRIGDVPVMLATPPDLAPDTRVPALLWMHGRTAYKELDPGRYLRLLRAGIGVCAIDLPGHGERFDGALQEPGATLDAILRMVEEIDGVVAALPELGPFAPARFAIGGMSAGGMATMARCCRPHPFVAAAVEASSGSWRHQATRAMFRERSADLVERHNPLEHLDGWREIPFQAIHTKADSWVAYCGQKAFIDALRAQYADPERIELVTYERTGAPFEHAGFGRMAADAKNRQRDFLLRVL